MASVAVEATPSLQTWRRRRGLALDVQMLALALRHCWQVGTLTLTGPDGVTHRLEGSEPGLDARMEIHDGRFVRRVLATGDVGFADSYIAGEWDSPDLPRLLTSFCANFDQIELLMSGQPLLRFVNWAAHALNKNSRAGSRRNISAHYDLGDDFYRLWLDGGMNYSSALYEPASCGLEAAQHAKHAALADTMELKPGMSVLEVGCGWGDFARYAAVERGAKVVAITVSQAQHDYAARRMQADGLNERVEIKLCDYRDLQGSFDRIASIEMFEAVGEAFWPVYFKKMRELLAPGGRAGLQIITIQDHLFDGYRRRPDFIQLNIFPGGMLPSERRLRQETDRVGLAWTGVRRFGQDYARTLAEWATRYGEAAEAVRVQGFDTRFDRLWRYYLAYCEAGFRTGRTDVVQLGLTAG